MKQLATGWRLATQSWAVLRSDASLAIYPVLAFLSAGAALALFVIAGAAGSMANGRDWPLVVGALTGSYLATFFTVYFNVALAGAAGASLRGYNTSLRDGLDVADARRGLIARWAVIQWLVGVLLEALRYALTDEDSPIGRTVGRILGALISSALGAAWGAATFFVVPVLAFESKEPGAAMHRSVSLIKENWGAGFVGHNAIGLVASLVGGVPAILLMWMGVTDPVESLAWAEMAAGATLLVATGVVASALTVIFRVALYRYAAEDQIVPAFGAGDMTSALRSPRSA